jgi:hypothetical protein
LTNSKQAVRLPLRNDAARSSHGTAKGIMMFKLVEYRYCNDVGFFDTLQDALNALNTAKADADEKGDDLCFEIVKKRPDYKKGDFFMYLPLKASDMVVAK